MLRSIIAALHICGPWLFSSLFPPPLAMLRSVLTALHICGPWLFSSLFPPPLAMLSSVLIALHICGPKWLFSSLFPPPFLHYHAHTDLQHLWRITWFIAGFLLVECLGFVWGSPTHPFPLTSTRLKFGWRREDARGLCTCDGGTLTQKERQWIWPLESLPEKYWQARACTHWSVALYKKDTCYKPGNLYIYIYYFLIQQAINSSTTQP